MTPDALRKLMLSEIDRLLAIPLVERWITDDQRRQVAAVRQLLTTDDTAMAHLTDVYNQGGVP